MEEEADYLVPTQLEVEPDSFAEVVMEAYLLEHGCTQRQEIGQLLGLDKSRISQIFGKPETLKTETVTKVMAGLSSTQHQRAIMLAWVRTCFGSTLLGFEATTVLGTADLTTIIRRIDRLIRLHRYWRAGMVCKEALKTTNDYSTRQQLYDRLYFCLQRLDKTGEAMVVVHRIFGEAASNEEPARMAGALLLKARILRGVADLRAKEVVATIAQARELLLRQKPGSSESPYIVGKLTAIPDELLALQLRLVEERVTLKEPPDWVAALERVEKEAQTSRSYQARSRKYQLCARIALAQGKPFKAEEYLQKSFESGTVKNLNSREGASIIQARIYAARGETDRARDYYLQVIRLCFDEMDLYHGRIAELELARLEGSKFPPSRPVF